MPETSYQKLLKEALDWLEDDAERMHIDNLFEKIERNAAGDERPVPEVALNALCNLIDRIHDILPGDTDD